MDVKNACFEKQPSKDSHRAQYNLAVTYELGIGGPVDRCCSICLVRTGQRTAAMKLATVAAVKSPLA